MKKHLIFIALVLVIAAVTVTIVYFVNENDKKTESQKVVLTLIMVSKENEIRQNSDKKGGKNLLDALKSFSREQPKYFPFKFDKKTESITTAGIAMADANGKITVFHNIDDPQYYDVDCTDENCTDKTCADKIKIGEIVYRRTSKKLSELPVDAAYTYVLAYRNS